MVIYDWGNGETCRGCTDDGSELLSFNVKASADRHSGTGFGCVIGQNKADNATFGAFNQYLASILPPDPKQEDFPDIGSFHKAHRWHCLELSGWPSIASSPKFQKLQRSVLSSESFKSEFIDGGCFLGKVSVVFGHDYILYKNALWAQSGDLNMVDCIAVIEDTLERERKRVDHSHQPANAAVYRRERISEDVRNEIWRRDQGRCVRCGSRERLEFDHIVPVSRGGANTVRNIELLCESCNRSKGDSL